MPWELPCSATAHHVRAEVIKIPASIEPGDIVLEGADVLVTHGRVLVSTRTTVAP